MSDEKTIIFPDADDLDTGGWSSSSGYRMELYLVPSEETKDGVVRVCTHSGVGNIGWPLLGFHHRWQMIASYGPQLSGEGVLGVLEESKDRLLGLASCYLGTHWDGSNYQGRWSEDAEEYLGPDLIDLSDCPSYWSADEWLIGESWESLCRSAGVEPDNNTALGKVLEDCLNSAGSEALLDRDDLEEVLQSKRDDWKWDNDRKDQ